MSLLERRSFITGLLGAAVVASCKSKDSESTKESESASETIGPLMPPATLAGRIDDVKSGKIAVLYMGPSVLFGKGHIPGAQKIGEAGEEAGKRALAEAIQKLPAETEIVLYCGCCPVRNCPNVRPASALLRSLNRKNATVLDLPTRFATDWADKGFPVERG